MSYFTTLLSSVALFYMSTLGGCFLINEPCLDCEEASYTYDPTQAGVDVVQTYDISAHITVPANSNGYGGFAKDATYFYYLESTALKTFLASDLSFVGSTDLLPSLQALATSESLPQYKIRLNPRIFVLRGEHLILQANFTDFAGTLRAKYVLYNISTTTSSLILFTGSPTHFGYNPDTDRIWAYESDIYSSNWTIYEYTYNAVSTTYDLFQQTQYSTQVSAPQAIDVNGVWRRQLSTHPVTTDTLDKFTNLNSTTSLYQINFQFLGHTAWAIIPDGAYLWSLTEGKIMKLKPL